MEIGDVNDNSPQFLVTSYTAELHENNYVGYAIVQVAAFDLDIGDNAKVTYVMGEENRGSRHFGVDRRTGSVTAKVSLDRENQSRYRFVVLAVDGGTPQRTGTATVEVAVLDVNDERPVFAAASYSLAVRENQRAGERVGRVSAEDADSPPYDRFSFFLLESGSPSDAFMVDPISGQISTIRTLDREDQEAYHLVAVARDDNSPSLSSTSVVMVTVNDVNDCAPVFRRPVDDDDDDDVSNVTVVLVSNFAARGHVVTSVRADDADRGENAVVSYWLEESNGSGLFSVDPQRGLILLTRTLLGREDNGVCAKTQGLYNVFLRYIIS